MANLDAVFYLSLSTLICGGFGLLIKVLYKIKCSEIKCCGCVEIKRDIEDELRVDLERGSGAEQRRSSISLGLK